MVQTVLLVDDDTHLLEGLRRALRREPYEVVAAGAPGDALAMLAARAIAVVVSDESMPGMPGTEFLGRVRVAYPETVRIMMTGQASVAVAVRSINEGAVYRFLTKPFHPSELVVTIRHALQERELLVTSRRLLETVRRQSAAIADLEREVRGVTDVTRDETGAILIEDTPVDIDALLREMQRELEEAERRLERD